MASSDESPKKKRFWREETSRTRRRDPSTSRVRAISTENRPSHARSKCLQDREERRQSSRNREEEKRPPIGYPVERMGRQASRREPDPEERMGRQMSRREPVPVAKMGKGMEKMLSTVPVPKKARYETPMATGSSTTETTSVSSAAVPLEKKAPYEPLKATGSSVSTKGFRSSLCPLPNCGILTRKLKKHCFVYHLPMVLAEKDSTPNGGQCRLDILNTLAKWLLGNTGNLEQLMHYMNTRRFPYFSQAISDELRANMAEICALQGWHRPPRFALVPMNSPAALLHWRILMEVLKLLPAERREELTGMYGGLPPRWDPSEEQVESEQVESEPPSTLIVTVSADGFNRGVSTAQALSASDSPVRAGQSQRQPAEEPKDLFPVYTGYSQSLPVEEQAYLFPVHTGQPQKQPAEEQTEWFPVLTGLSQRQPPERQRDLFPVHTGLPESATAGDQLTAPMAESVETTAHEAQPDMPPPQFVVPVMPAVPRRSFPTVSAAPQPRCQAIDSHFHLNRTRSRLWGPSSEATSDELIACPCVPMPNPSVHVYGGVEVYCDPEEFPVRLHNNPFFKIAIGVHPKLINQLTPDRKAYLRHIIASTHMEALGEVGIDRTVDCELWARQVEFLEEVAGWCDTNKPLVLHIRGSKQDTYGSDANACAREVIREACQREQPIHLHCFSSESSQVRRWLRAFPNCFFSFSGQVAKFTEEQQEALRVIPSNRLLIETDSPYLHPRGFSINTPSYIGEVAAIVAGIRGESLTTILDMAFANARLLYYIQ